MNENILLRKEKLKERKEKIIKEADKKAKRLDEYIEILNKSEILESDNFETIIYKLYMQLDNVTDVTKEINNLGYRIKTFSWQGQRKYTTNDITKILTDKDTNVDEELKAVVQEIQAVNYGKISKWW